MSDKDRSTRICQNVMDAVEYFAEQLPECVVLAYHESGCVSCGAVRVNLRVYWWVGGYPFRYSKDFVESGKYRFHEFTDEIQQTVATIRFHVETTNKAHGNPDSATPAPQSFPQ